jgi:hypothetical protein
VETSENLPSHVKYCMISFMIEAYSARRNLEGKIPDKWLTNEGLTYGSKKIKSSSLRLGHTSPTFGIPVASEIISGDNTKFTPARVTCPS